MNFLRRIDIITEIAYKARSSFQRINHNSKALSPRLPTQSTITIKTNINRFYVGDIIALRNPDDYYGDSLLREVTAGPGSEIKGECGAVLILEDNEYWVASRQPNAIDSEHFGPIDANTLILGRAVHCSTMRHWINNSATARAEDLKDQWVVPLSPQSISDLATLWSKTRNNNFLDAVLPDNHRSRPGGPTPSRSADLNLA